LRVNVVYLGFRIGTVEVFFLVGFGVTG